MSKFIHDGKVYDTSTATEVFKHKIEGLPIFNAGGALTRDVTELTIYKTEKGNWFAIARDKKSEGRFEACKEEDVKSILTRQNAVEIYEEHFGALERA